MPTTDLASQWGARITERRTAAGMSRATLAAAVGCHRQHIYKLENGEHAPSDALRIKLAAALNTTVPELFSYEDAAA